MEDPPYSFEDTPGLITVACPSCEEQVWGIFISALAYLVVEWGYMPVHFRLGIISTMPLAPLLQEGAVVDPEIVKADFIWSLTLQTSANRKWSNQWPLKTSLHQWCFRSKALMAMLTPAWQMWYKRVMMAVWLVVTPLTTHDPSLSAVEREGVTTKWFELWLQYRDEPISTWEKAQDLYWNMANQYACDARGGSNDPRVAFFMTHKQDPWHSITQPKLPKGWLSSAYAEDWTYHMRGEVFARLVMKEPWQGMSTTDKSPEALVQKVVELSLQTAEKHAVARH